MTELDRSLFLALNGDMGDFADKVFLFLTSHTVFVIFIVIALFLILKKYGFWAALISLLIILAGIGTCDMISNVFKYNIEKFRPIYTADIQLQAHYVADSISGGLYGPVSAHAATSFLVAIFTSMVISNKYYTIFAIIAALLISYSRIYLASHFPLDIIFGIILGTGVAMLYYALLMFFTEKRIKR